MERPERVLDALMAVIEDRNRKRPADSYTVRLLEGGVEAIGGKVLEEAAELVAAARDENAAAVVHEAADLFYHVLVLLARRNVALADVEGELGRRFGISGLQRHGAAAPLGEK